MGGINWGDAPTWVAGTFAAAAAYYARGTLKSQQHQIQEQRQFIAEQSANLALERSELRAVAEERRRAQADQVELQRAPYWRLHNHSNAPLYDVTMMFGGRPATTSNELFITEGIPRAMAGEAGGGTVPVMGAGRTFVFSTDPEPARDEPVSVLFTDEDGVRWSLDGHGKLEELPETPPTI
ncbi:hypothetical protein ACWD11_03145 [Streptomyces sp. NPDC002776]